MALTHIDEDLKKANPRAALVRIEVRDTQGYSNQRRHDLRIGPQPKYVRKEERGRNRVLVEPVKPADLRQLARDRRAQRDMSRAMKKDAGVAIIGIIAFGVEAQRMFQVLSTEQQNEALLAAVKRFAKDLNTTVSGLVLHLDETAGHGHFSLCGYDLDGEPISNKMKKGLLSGIQTALHEEMRLHMPDLERGRRRKIRAEAGASEADLVHKTVAELHDQLPFDLAERQADLAALDERRAAAEAKLRRNEDLAEKARAKATADDERSEKARRNAERYDERAAAAKSEIKNLEDRKNELEKEIDRLAQEARTDREEARKERAAAVAEKQEQHRRKLDLDAFERKLEQRETWLKKILNHITRTVRIAEMKLKIPSRSSGVNSPMVRGRLLP